MAINTVDEENQNQSCHRRLWLGISSCHQWLSAQKVMSIQLLKQNCDTVHHFDAHDDNDDDDVDDNIDDDDGETFYVNSITTNCNRVQLSKLHLDLVRMPETVFTTVMVMKKGSQIELAVWVQFQKW